MLAAIYQPMRVGSFSLLTAVEERFKGDRSREVVHLHGSLPGISGSAGERRLVETYEGDDDCRLIIPVRDPVDWAVSVFFFRFRRYTELPFEELLTRTTSELRDLFSTWFDHDELERWFAENVVDRFGLDLYADDFSTDGHEILVHDGHPFLFYRCELSNETIGQVVGDFLEESEPFVVEQLHEAEGQPYAAAYNAFVAEIDQLLVSYTSRAYSSTYAQHFYPDGRDTVYG